MAFVFVALTTTACGVGAVAVPTRTPTLVPPTETLAPTTTPTATLPPPTATSAPSINPLDALTKAYRAWAGVKSFRSKMTTTGVTTGTQEMTLEVVMPDRFHMVGKQFEAIIIGATFYMKVGTQWQKTTLPKGLDFSLADIKKILAELGATTQVKLIGPDVLDGAPMLVYEYTTTIKTPTTTTVTSKVWVAVADGLPRKMESLSKSGIKTVATYYDYNANITIKAPVP